MSAVGRLGRTAPGVRRIRALSLRARVTVVAGLGVTAAIVAGLLVFYQLQTSSLRSTIDTQLRTYATEISQSHTRAGWPSPLPSSSLDSNAEAQVFSADGQVLAATRTLVGLPPIYLLPPGSSQPVRQKAADGVIPTDIQVVAERVTVGGTPVVVITGTGTGLLSSVSEEYVHHVLVGLPVILVLSALIVWLVVGRALRPVGRIRTTVTAITAADLSQRVPVPQTTDEIGMLARTMNDMLDRLDSSARRQRRFVADASHELRSPLAAIRTTLEVALAHPDKAPWPTVASRAAEQSARLEELIDQLLRLARADERSTPGQVRQVDLRALVGEVLQNSAAHPLDVDVSIGADAVVVGNAADLQRLVRNVVDNAIRYAGSTVAIAATVTADGVVLTVDDDGPGIPFVDRERVFDRFVRLDASRDRASGSAGLGLAIAREIADAHQGRMAFSDSPLGGARLTVTLPVAAVDRMPAD